jgi:hypothetical protein
MKTALALALGLAATTATAQPAPESPAPESPAPEVIAGADPPRFAPWTTDRFALEAELSTQARVVRRAGEDLSELQLDRAELGGWIRAGAHAAAELRIEAVRSAVEGGALGVDGDSTVFRVKTAQMLAEHELGPVRLEGALGFVPDPWIATLEDDYSVRPLSRTGSERVLGWATTDLSVMVRATVGPVRASVAVGNGEGNRYPERNTGKTTTGVVEVVPVATPALRLSVAAVGRDGSLGVSSIRERRVGGGLTAVTPWVRAGGEAVLAYGIGDRGDLEGLELAGWVEARVVDRVAVAARGATLGYRDVSGRSSTYGGAIAVDAWRGPMATRPGRARGQFRIWLAVDRVTTSGAAMPLPGADAGNATQIMLIGSALAPFAVE